MYVYVIIKYKHCTLQIFGENNLMKTKLLTFFHVLFLENDLNKCTFMIIL